MAKLQHEIKINAPIEKVWSVLADLQQVGEYNPMVASVKLLSTNKTGIGASRECQFKPKGSVKDRITAMEELSFLTMEMYESDWPMKYMNWTNYLTANNGVTTMKTITDYKVKFGILGSLMDRVMMKQKFNKILEEVFVSFKQHVETKN